MRRRALRRCAAERRRAVLLDENLLEQVESRRQRASAHDSSASRADVSRAAGLFAGGQGASCHARARASDRASLRACLPRAQMRLSWAIYNDARYLASQFVLDYSLLVCVRVYMYVRTIVGTSDLTPRTASTACRWRRSVSIAPLASWSSASSTF